MSQDWTEKYRPRSLNDVLGNPKAVSELKAWATSWDKGTPKQKAVILMGSPGIGKTTSAEALANDMGWDILEMNASDQRTGDAIRSVALKGAYSNTFSTTGDYLNVSEGKRKLIVLDEADSLFGNADRGALPAIVELIRDTKQPVILIVNDFYALSRKSSAIKTETLQISFLKPSAITISKALRNICAAEGIDISDDAVRSIAENANGDMRAAVRDLESMSMGKKSISAEDTEEISGRNVRKSMFDLMSMIFRKRDPFGARKMVEDVDEDPNTVLLWVDENIPREYFDSMDLNKGFDKLSHADIFLGRVMRRQYYGMWKYATDLMTAGVCIVKTSPRISHDRLMNPQYLTKMSRTKSVRATKASLCRKLADYLHTSTRRVSVDVIPPLKSMLTCDPELRVALVKNAGLESEELAFLLNKKIDSKEVKEAIDTAAGITETKQKTKPKIDESMIFVEPEVKKAEKPVPAKGQKNLFDF